MVEHTIPPVWNERSRVLILGSFPSVKSREEGFFYGHKQNRFWKVMAAVVGEQVPKSVAEKKEMLLRNGIAVWDVIAQCEIEGSADGTIKEVVPNDLSEILSGAKIERIFVNGKTAEKYYRKYIERTVGRSAECLPSTSPANAVWTEEKLIAAWKHCISAWLRVFA